MMNSTKNDNNTTITATTSNRIKQKKVLFVTVGTTLFEALIEQMTSESALDWMYANEYQHLIIQYGKGQYPQIPMKYQYPQREQQLEQQQSQQQEKEENDHVLIHLEIYDYKSSLEADIQRADLIISHAGAGTLMEILQYHKLCIVVINTLLMNNHQYELAYALEKHQYVLVIPNGHDSKYFQFPPPNNDNNNNSTNMDNNVWLRIHSFQPMKYQLSLLGTNHNNGNHNNIYDMDFPQLLDSFLGFHHYPHRMIQKDEDKKES